MGFDEAAEQDYRIRFFWPVVALLSVACLYLLFAAFAGPKYRYTTKDGIFLRVNEDTGEVEVSRYGFTKGWQKYEAKQ